MGTDFKREKNTHLDQMLQRSSRMKMEKRLFDLEVRRVLFVSPQNSYTEILTPGDGIGRQGL